MIQSSPGSQADFSLEHQASRKYEIATFGTADTVLVLFEEVNGELRLRPVTMTQVRTAAPITPQNNFRTAAMWQRCDIIGPVNRYKQPSCTGSSDRRLPPASRRRQRNQQNAGSPVATLIIRSGTRPHTSAAPVQGPGQSCSMKAILTKPYA
jgi:hypothetical protein